jgi:hypothetical protein
MRLVVKYITGEEHGLDEGSIAAVDRDSSQHFQFLMIFKARTRGLSYSLVGTRRETRFLHI